MRARFVIWTLYYNMIKEPLKRKFIKNHIPGIMPMSKFEYNLRKFFRKFRG